MFGARVIWGPGEGWIHSLTWCQLEGCCSIFHLPTSMLEGLMNCYILQPRFIDSVLFRWGRSVESVLIPWPYPHFAEFSGTHATLMTNAHALSCWIVTSNMMLLWNSWDSLPGYYHLNAIGTWGTMYWVLSGQRLPSFSLLWTLWFLPRT